MPKNPCLMLTAIILTLFANLPVLAQTDKKKDDLIKLEKSYFDAVIAKKYDFLDQLLATDYIGAYSSGTIDKTKESKDLREFPLKNYEMSDIKVIFPDSKIGIIAFKLHVTVTVDGKDYSEDDILDCVWIKKGKNWLLTSQSAVKVGKNSE